MIAENNAEGSFRVLADESGPVALALYVREHQDLAGVSVRDGAERRGLATRLVRDIQKEVDLLRANPVTCGGKALMAKCGFAPEEGNAPTWIWRRGS